MFLFEIDVTVTNVRINSLFTDCVKMLLQNVYLGIQDQTVHQYALTLLT